jgi:hypothetical protein
MLSFKEVAGLFTTFVILSVASRHGDWVCEGERLHAPPGHSGGQPERGLLIYFQKECVLTMTEPLPVQLIQTVERLFP